MASILINGQESSVRTEGLEKITDVIEMVKTIIDPEHLITAIFVDGDEATDEFWTSSARDIGTKVIDFETSTVDSFLSERLLQSANVVQACYVQFRDARKSFKYDGGAQGNKKLAVATNTLQAFFQWFESFYRLIAANRQREFSIEQHTQKVLDVCQKVCQQQLYQSWWALAQTLEKELEPALDELENFAREFPQKLKSSPRLVQ